MKNRGLDSKYSWMVAVAGSIVFLLTTWPMRLGSQLFVFMIERYDTTRKAASFPFSLSYFMRSISGPIVGFFGEKFGLQQVTLFGCFLCALGVGGCFFAENIITVDLCLGIIFGTGFGLSTLIVPEIINLHFDQHRAKANGIVFAGGGLGAFITPPIIEMILNDYGVSETFLIMCAILLNAIPAAMLMSVPKTSKKVVEIKSPETFKDIKSVRPSQDISSCLQYHASCLEEKPKTNKEISNVEFPEYGFLNGHYNPVAKTEIILNEKNENESKICTEDEYLSKNPDFKIVNESKMSMSDVFFPHEVNFSKSNFLGRSRQGRRLTPVLIDVRNLRKPSLPGSTESLQTLNEIEALEKLSTKSPYASCNVLWDPVFLTLTLIQSLSLYVMYIFWTITVDIVRDKGVHRNLEIYFVMSQSLFDMIGTATLGIIPDSGYMSEGNFCAFCFGSMGLSCILLIYVSGFWPTIVGISILSAVLGGNVTGLPGIITQFIDEDKRGMAMASRFIMYAPMSFTMSPLIGYFRGTLGSYDGLMYTLAGMCTLCTILLLILPRVIKRKNKRKGLQIK
ncbi:monocarboxylate transporter 12-like [Parasteatoda tepidariorum]|uniref:monocarboxylate transporter 12-like n=1 Tax=Parasteatoda tepidariorum TaxID=114398 RepID=UPI00077FAAA5|nr:uncharacterized protein LOC107456540 [Parasteatoda tepidariorum]XP_015929907.1 uncharacterized protein LOC107456540 [Parasteatoda tepidariorum]XP_015929908.1 uncharacterized protein LOC107456540 [Parasteatoda tepidariorum]